MWVILPNIIRELNMFNLPIQNHNGIPVMSSIDLAKMCVPALTKSGKENKDQHSDFMKKAKDVLDSTFGNFSERETYGNNNTRTILLLPEREACLMAMSYSYELQAKVYDAWQALRNVTSTIPTSMEMIAAISAHAVKQEKALLHLESQVTHIGSEVDLIKNKLDNTYWFAYCFLTVVTVAGEHPTSAATFLTLKPESNADMIFSCNS
jgi:hypothetical protein